jgi:hypothetical protein
MITETADLFTGITRLGPAVNINGMSPGPLGPMATTMGLLSLYTVSVASSKQPISSSPLNNLMLTTSPADTPLLINIVVTP